MLRSLCAADQIHQLGAVFGFIIVPDGLRGFAEGLHVNLIDFHAGINAGLQVFFIHGFGQIPRDLLGFLGALINQVLLLFRQAVPAFVGEDKYGGGVNVVGQRQVFLHLIEAGRNDVGEGFS